MHTGSSQVSAALPRVQSTWPPKSPSCSNMPAPSSFLGALHAALGALTFCLPLFWSLTLQFQDYFPFWAP